MDKTSNKKRKTSPTTSVPGGASNNTPRRPSFASPPKASIARGFPQLLEHSKSSENPKNAGRATPSRQSSQPLGTPLRGTTNRSTRSGRTPQPTKASQPSEDAEFNPFKPSRTLTRDPIVPAQPSQLPEEAEANPFKPTRTLARYPIVPTPTPAPAPEVQIQADKPATSLSPPQHSRNLRQLPRQSPRIYPGTSKTPEPVHPTTETATEAVTPVTEPVQPHPTDEQPSATRLEPSATRSGTVQRSPRLSPRAPTVRETAPIVLRVENVEEPELPPTPTQRGLQDPVVTTPPPGIHNTPSKSKRPKSRGKGTPVKSSPLKPRAPPPAELEKPVEEPTVGEEGTYPTRHSFVEDKYATKRKIRDQLLKELEQLQEDVELAERENDRLHEQQVSGRKTLELVDASNLSSLFQRTIAPELKPQPPKSPFHSISSILPFSGRRRKPLPETNDKPVGSHQPLVQENPLPFLNIFTPLTFESTISILPSVEPATPEYLPDTLQKHVIYASSGNGLFSARISLVANTAYHSIVSLDVESLTSHAQPELGVFGRSCSAKKDAGSLFWALGRWYEVSLRRARFWCAVERDFGNGMRVIESGIRRQRSRRKRKVVEEVVEEEEEGGKDGGKEEVKWSRKEMVLHMGRRNMVLKGKGVELMVQWGIKFDWTGEADSSISADVRVLKSWHEGDDRRSLDKIPQTFSRLVENYGPLDAVRTIVALLSKE